MVYDLHSSKFEFHSREQRTAKHECKIGRMTLGGGWELKISVESATGLVNFFQYFAAGA
jgi:hypothetical protein